MLHSPLFFLQISSGYVKVGLVSPDLIKVTLNMKYKTCYKQVLFKELLP